MPTLHLLGTGAAVSDPHRNTTMLAFADAADTFVVDCGGDVVQRLLAAGIDLETVSSLFITHEHPDHVSGFPLFMEKIWLWGRGRPIPLRGIAPALNQARRCFGTFDTSRWTLPEMQWHEVAHAPGALVLDDATWRITATPGVHAVPVVGLRVESKTTGGVVAYSCDTEPADTIADLARGANILVHEANGDLRGHSSAEEAARIAAQAGVDHLVLVHLPPGLTDADLTKAHTLFPHITLGDELDTFGF